jgi:putative endonuclease
MKYRGFRGEDETLSMASGPRGRKFKSCHPDLMFVYVLRSTVTGRYYTGSCQEITDRLHRHNTGQSKATRHGAPWVLVYQETHATRIEAVRRELYFKTGKGREELTQLLGTHLD